MQIVFVSPVETTRLDEWLYGQKYFLEREKSCV
jgi:hypothetical protein